MLRCESLTWLEPEMQSKTSHWSAVDFKKADLDKVQLEPAIWHVTLVSGYLVLTGVVMVT